MGEIIYQRGVLIVSEHNIFRQCLANSLQQASGFTCDFADGKENALEKMSAGPRRVVLIDHDGQRDDLRLELAAAVSRAFPEARVLIIGQPRPEREVLEYLVAGAAAYVPKGHSIKQLLEAIDSALKNEVEVSPEGSRWVYARLQQLAREKSSSRKLSTDNLTLREIEVLENVDQGMSNKEIATALHLSVHTVKNHVHRILEKMGAGNRREAVFIAYQHGILSGRGRNADADQA